MLTNGHYDRMDFRLRTNLLLSVMAIVSGGAGYLFAPAIGAAGFVCAVICAGLGAMTMGGLLSFMHSDQRQIRIIFLMTAATVLLVGTAVMASVTAWFLVSIAALSVLFAGLIGTRGESNWLRLAEVMITIPFAGAVIGWFAAFDAKRAIRY